MNLIIEYLSDRFQRTKVGETFSTWRRILFGFSILVPLLLNIYLNDLFLSSPDFELANYVDVNSLFEYSDHVDAIVGKLEKYALFFIEWFERNYLVPNPSKWHLILSDTNVNYWSASKEKPFIIGTLRNSRNTF